MNLPRPSLIYISLSDLKMTNARGELASFLLPTRATSMLLFYCRQRARDEHAHLHPAHRAEYVQHSSRRARWERLPYDAQPAAHVPASASTLRHTLDEQLSLEMRWSPIIAKEMNFLSLAQRSVTTARYKRIFKLLSTNYFVPQ